MVFSPHFIGLLARVEGNIGDFYFMDN